MLIEFDQQTNGHEHRTNICMRIQKLSNVKDGLREKSIHMEVRDTKRWNLYAKQMRLF